MQTPFEMAWLILKQGQVGRIGPDSLMSHRNPIDPSRGQSQYRSNSLMDSAYAGRGTPPPLPRDSSLDEFTVPSLRFPLPVPDPEETNEGTKIHPEDNEGIANPDLREDKSHPDHVANWPMGSMPVEMSDIRDFQRNFGHPTESDTGPSYNKLGPNFYYPPASNMHEGAAHNLDDMVPQLG